MWMNSRNDKNNVKLYLSDVQNKTVWFWKTKPKIFVYNVHHPPPPPRRALWGNEQSISIDQVKLTVYLW